MVKQTVENLELTPLAVFSVVVLCMLFGANAVAIKTSLIGLGVFFSAGMRFSIASFVLIIWAVATRRSFKLEKRRLFQILTISVIFTAQLSMFYFGLSKTTASRGTLIINLQPFFVLFLAHFFIPGDAITRRKLFGILLGFCGIVFLFLEQQGTTAEFRAGELLILATTFVWGVNVVYTKKVIAGFKPFQIALYPMIFAIPVLFFESFLWDEAMVGNLDWKVAAGMAYQSLVTASFGFVAWNTMLKRYGAVTLHSFVFIMPVSGVVLGWMVLGEAITYKILVAMLLITAGLLVTHIKQDRFPPVFPLGRNV